VGLRETGDAKRNLIERKRVLEGGKSCVKREGGSRLVCWETEYERGRG